MRLKCLVSLALSLFILNCPAPVTVSPQALEQEKACMKSLKAADYQSAQTRCQLCLEYNDRIPMCINGLGLVAFANNDFVSAARHFTKAAQISPNFGQARNNLAAIHFRKKEYSEAIPLFTAAIQIDPGYVDARYNLALCHLRLGRIALTKKNIKLANHNFSLADEQYRLLNAVDAKYANSYRDMGLIQTYRASIAKSAEDIKDELDQAKEFFKKCLHVDAHNEGCRESYGHTLLYLNDFSEALYQFVQCLSINKKNPVCIQGMEDAYSGSKIKSAALNSYIQQLKKNPDNAEGHFGYCQALFEEKMDKEAVTECETALRLDSKICNAYHSLGMHYKQVLNSKEALSNCKSYVLCVVGKENSSKVKQCQNVIAALDGQ